MKKNKIICMLLVLILIFNTGCATLNKPSNFIKDFEKMEQSYHDLNEIAEEIPFPFAFTMTILGSIGGMIHGYYASAKYVYGEFASYSNESAILAIYFGWVIMLGGAILGGIIVGLGAGIAGGVSELGFTWLTQGDKGVKKKLESLNSFIRKQQMKHGGDPNIDKLFDEYKNINRNRDTAPAEK